MKVSPSQSQFLILFFFAIPMFVFFRLWWLYWTRGRDPARDSITTQYGPPDNLTPGECGALMENAVPIRHITSTIVDLSVRGFLSMGQNDDATMTGAKDFQHYVFHMIKGPDDWKALKPHEQAVLKAIFLPTNPLRMLTDAMSRLQNAAKNSALASSVASVMEMTEADPNLRRLNQALDVPKNSVAFMDLRTHFSLHMTAIRQSTFDSLVAGNYYVRRPDQVRLLYAAAGVLIGLVMAVAGVVLATSTNTDRLPWVVTGILTGTIILGFGRLLSARTVLGVRTVAKIVGFKDFIGRVEKDRIQRLETTPELFEKFLPYAMALGVENIWTQAFGEINVPPPQWYQRQHGGGFLPADLVDDMNAMSHQAGTTMPSKPNGDSA
jgi:hypothetical protein